MKRNIVAGLCTAMGLLMSGGACYAEAPPQGTITFGDINYGGSGCPQGTVSPPTFSEDRTSFTLIFDALIAAGGPGIPVTDNRKSCQLSLDMRWPAGWSFAIVTLDYRGFAGLDAGVWGSEISTYYFQGSTKNAVLRTDFKGPISQDYLIRDTLGLQALAWSPCQSIPLNVKAEVRVQNTQSTAGGRQGQLTVDSLDGKVYWKYGLIWRKCTASTS